MNKNNHILSEANIIVNIVSSDGSVRFMVRVLCVRGRDMVLGVNDFII